VTDLAPLLSECQHAVAPPPEVPTVSVRPVPPLTCAPMPTVTIYPLGNADTTRIDLANGKKVLVDYADMRCATDPHDKRADLPAELRLDLKAAGRSSYDAVAFTHLDNDHILGSSDFFHFDYAKKYQGGDRIRMNELWVPAAAIVDPDCEDDSYVIREEAKYRLKQGYGVRVFSSPGVLDDWLRKQGIDPATRRHLIVDAGTLVPTFTLASDGVEFFAHSPFASRTADGKLLERNRDAIAMQATFRVGTTTTRLHLFSDLTWDVIEEVVRVTEFKGRTDPSRLDRLRYDVFKIPHHTSYLSLAAEKGERITDPAPLVKRLYEVYGRPGALLVSTSDPIPSGDTVQPPHRQAAAYYRSVAQSHGGRYIVTMEHPSKESPKPLVIDVSELGAKVLPPPVPTGWGAAAVIGAQRPSSGVIDHG